MCFFKKKKNILLAENKFGTGFVPDQVKDTDYVFTGAEEFDWDKGFDIEDVIREELGVYDYNLQPNNQKQSSSCVAQAWDKYAEVQYLLKTKKEINLSPRFVYSNIHLPNGGAYVYMGGAFMRDVGSVPDEVLPSEPMTEEHLRDKGPFKDGIGNDFKVFRDLVDDGVIQLTWLNIDAFAKAIRDNKGLVFGVYGTNNGTWYGEFPKAPNSSNDIQWGHALYAGKAKMINGKKYIGVLNSWGNVGQRGWQWLGEEWINTTFASSARTWVAQIGDIDDLATFKKIEAYIDSNNLKWNKDDVWADIQFKLGTTITRGEYYDYLQVKKYL